MLLFYQNKFSYKINIKDTLNIPHGDLIAVDICLDDEKKNQLKVKRKQKFITDKYGFRNSKIDLSESDLILVGDSQISGSSLTDEFAKKGRKNQKVCFQYSSTVIRQCLLINDFKNELSVDDKQERLVKNFAPYIHEENSVSIFERLEKAIKNIERNANPKIIFYELSLQMMRLLKVKRKLAN